MVAPSAKADESAGTEPGCLTARWFALLFAALLFATFPKVLLGLETFSYIDSGLFAYPVAFYHRECFWRGEIPFWNPLSECGIPFLAQWNTMTLYPPSLIYLLLPMPWSFGLFCIVHLLGAAMGMYYLALNWTKSTLAASVAGTFYGFNGLFWYGLMWPNMVAAACWAPWLLLLHTRAWKEGGRWILAAGAIGALQLLTGGVEFILQTWMILAVFCFMEAIAHRKVCLRILLRGLSAACIAGGLAAAQLLPFLDLLRHSERSAGVGDTSVAAMSLAGWANFLVPLFQYCPNVQGVLVPTKLSWTGSWYLGISIIPLAAWAIWKARDRRTILLALSALLGLVLAMGKDGILYDSLKAVIPIIGMIRFPVKFVFLAVFALPLLAAVGTNSLASLKRRGDADVGRLAFRLWMGVTVAALVVMAVGWLGARPNHDIPAMLISGAIRIMFLAAVAMALLRSSRSMKVSWAIVLPVLLWADVFTHGSNLSPTVPNIALQENAVREHFGWTNELRAGESRAMLGRASLQSLLAGGSPQPEIDTQGRRMALFMNYNLLDGVPKIDGLYSLELQGYGLVRSLWLGTNDALGLRSFLGVSHLNNPANITEWLSLEAYLPLVTCGQRPVPATEASQIAGLLSPQFNPIEAVYLPADIQNQVSAPGGGAQVKRTKFSSHRLEVEVESTHPAVVVIAQAFYHCWKVHVNGEEAPLQRANHFFQAVQIPAGRHEIVLTYRDRAFQLGLGISITSAMFWVAAWLRFKGLRQPQAS